MKKGLNLPSCGIIVLTMFLAGCGDSSSTPAANLGAINKIGVTAIPNSNATAKPVLARNFIEKGMNLLFNQNVANAAGGTCSITAPIVETIPGGTIEIDEAIVILDQVEAEQQNEAENGPKVGPFALDLLDNNPDAGETISMDLPAGNYKELKTDFKRIDDNPNNTIPLAITTKLTGELKRRPSVWIKGFLSDGTNVSSCKEFIFVTDHRWRIRVPFVNSFTDAGNGVDLVVVFRLVDALKDALTKNTADVTGLSAEVGAGTVDPMAAEAGVDFLDGRTKDKDHGTALAEAWAAELPLNMDVFAQNRDDNPNVDGTTLVDDSAARISGDDNPSASDLP